ncbi:Ger(x)C family spore germination protein [Pelosinus propionicus]|uniref:Ger(x)C family spore germination protein n=1 Tax=Pelosinus propionicus TaxID=380084 RepID=UPI000B830FFC|nr:Ger(x)C family spore germination protein [Pelosinus propionicus]
MLTDMGGLIRNRIFKRWTGCILILILSICLSGCWDRRELQERHFVLAVAIDKADEGLGAERGKDVDRVEDFVQPHGSKLYRLSFQILQLTPSNNSEGAGRGNTSTSVISTTGESMLEMIWDLQGQSNKELWFDHVQTIIISDAAAKQGGLQPILDFYHRNEEIRWLTKVVITDGEARDLLDYKPPSGEASGLFIANSLRMYAKSQHVPGWHTDLGDISTSKDNRRRVLLPRIEMADDVVKLGGMAIFKNEKFVGYVDEYATQGGKLMGGLERSAVITFQCPEHSGSILAFELFSHTTKIKPHVEGEKIYYTLDINIRGNMAEMQCRLQHDTIKDQDIHKLEQLVANVVKENILYSFRIFQDLKVDASFFGPKLEIYEPQVWERVKDHWDDEVFPKTSLIISVNVVIEGVGAHQ